ncbi:MAG: prepilin-type N-terminal cleavage/methylation domain-containing protein [Acidobacteria bacterium]|nr:prepilin-type N-terminal cleavage/methylation domain-containing protein [Acidobacteriota bacterium]MBU1474956.1 prepilin-type N-terminal cleavage/methylation domain-containing protein [Acidobacteriota bacterium]MBU4494721.1 prepilin-type N-terminal cleavage/methylation domain-containing protein [Acidobacteriota bacterium]MCG2815459.1 prepilin-type N-terminal cleavage/methylation domain-containing protein [Candidatus Aminicenantes bacterium]
MTQVERRGKKSEGFSLIEVLISMVLIAVAMLGLAQLFTYSILSNDRADKMTSSTFLAQQQIDTLRCLTSEELSALSSPMDETLDVNGDGTIDFRRVTALQSSGTIWDVKVLLFPGSQTGVAVNLLLQNPRQYYLRAEMGTIISR